MSEKPEKQDRKQSVTAEDVRAAFMAGKLSARRYDLLTTSRKLTREELLEKAAAVGQVQLYKDRRDRKYLRLSNNDAQRKHQDKLAAIDERLDAARASIDWDRRREAEKSLHNWIKTYCMDAPPAAQLFKYAPSERLAQAIQLADAGISEASFPWHIRIARGFGKSTIAEAAAAFAVATCKRRFVVIVSAKADDAVQLTEDVFGIFAQGETFAADYPDIAVPLRVLDGSWRRRMTYRGKRISFAKTYGKVVLPTVVDADGTTSTAIIAARGFDGRVRGMKHGSMRPDLLILDDLQTDQDAHNEETVAKSVARVRSTFLNLAGREKLSVIMTSTPIASDDLSETFASDPSWKSTTFKAFDAWPTEWTAHGMEGLWGEYQRSYQRELFSGDGSTDPRKDSTSFYLANRERMDAGASVLDENRFDAKSGQVSAVQALMDKFFEIGPEAFDAEMQMQPRRQQFAFELTPQVVLQRVRRGVAPGSLVPNHVLTVATTDINPSYALSTTILSFDVQRTGLVAAYHKTPISISDRTNDTAYHAKIYEALTAHVREVVDMCRRSNVKLDDFGIDAGGKQFDSVCAFAAEAEKLVGQKVTAMTGRAGQAWNPFVRSRIRAPLNETVWCRDTQGRTWLAFNADVHKEAAQKAFGTETGAPGGLTLFDGGVDHTDFAIQASNERLVEKKSRPDGRSAYRWRSRNPHDYGDCLAMAYALAGANGISGSGVVATTRRKVAVCL